MQYILSQCDFEILNFLSQVFVFNHRKEFSRVGHFLYLFYMYINEVKEIRVLPNKSDVNNF